VARGGAVALRVGTRYTRLSCSAPEGYNSSAAGSVTPESVGTMADVDCRRVWSVVVVGLLLAILASEASSQPPTVPEPPLVIDGRVLWVDFGSQTMALAPANGTPAITIDLRRLPQSDYHGFRGNEYVRVVGYILRPSRRVQAFELYLVTPWYPMEPQSP
jgi:hypothetical protein